MMSGHLKNRTPQMHSQRSFKEKLLTAAGVKKFHTPTNLFQNISYRNKIMQIIFFMTASQDTENTFKMRSI